MLKRIMVLGVALLGVGSGPAAAQDQFPEFGNVVLEVARTELQSWITDPVFIFAIREQNELYQDLSERRIQRLDRRWINEGGFGPMIGDLIDRQASVILRDRRALSDGLINEIILMDQFGLNVAISDPTSDFYQGDEAKYQETYLIGPDAVHVSEIEWDESTQKNQSQVSLTITDPETGEPIGAVTFGIDVEIAIARGS